jgi:hypothetical protein
LQIGRVPVSVASMSTLGATTSPARRIMRVTQVYTDLLL